MEGKDWFRDLRTGLEEADIIICLGSFLALYKTGDQLHEYMDLIASKLNAGGSTFFQGCAQVVNIDTRRSQMPLSQTPDQEWDTNRPQDSSEQVPRLSHAFLAALLCLS